MKHLLLYSLALLVLTSCGVNYRPLMLEKVPFQNSTQLEENVTISYLYDVQTATKNRRYAKKERKSGFATVAVRIKNDSDRPITLTQDNLLVSISGGRQKFALPVETYTQKVTQHPPVHLLHALWGPWQFSYMENSATGQRTSSFKYYPVGAVIGVINLLIAANGNKHHNEQMTANQLYGKTVEPGKTVNGIIILPMATYEPLTFELKE